MSRSNVKTVLSIASVLALAPFAVDGGPERPAVVTVRVWTGGGAPERATGTVIAPGRVLTVAHVLEGAQRVEVEGVGGAGTGAGVDRAGAGGDDAGADVGAGGDDAGVGAARVEVAGAGAGAARVEAAGAGGDDAGAGGAGVGGDGAGTARAGRVATVVWRDAALDLAVLRVPGANGPPVRFGAPDGELRVLTARGSGEARSAVAAHAGVAVPARLVRRIDARLVDQPGKPRRASLELAADMVSGDSGAPVLDADGEIVAIVYARSTRRGGTAYAVRVLVAPAARGERARWKDLAR